MAKKNIFHIVLYIAVFLLVSNNSSAQTTYTLGVVPQFDSRKIEAAWNPILNIIYRHTGIRIELKGSPSIPEFEKKFLRGEFDFAYMNPYHLIVANKSQGYLPLVRDTGRMLFGVVVVHKDSPIQSIKELNGKTIAFPAPNALGAALIPRAEFTRKFDIEVIPRYVKSHSSVYLNVALGQTVAGGGVQKTLEQQPDNIKKSLRILYQTTKVPSHPITYHPRISPEVTEIVKNALINFESSPDDAKLLRNIPIKKAGAASLSDYDMLDKMGLDEFYIKSK